LKFFSAEAGIEGLRLPETIAGYERVILADAILTRGQDRPAWNHKALIFPWRGGENTSRLLRRAQALNSAAKSQPDRCLRRVPFWPPGPNRGGHAFFQNYKLIHF
jgi:hypothetical protein